MSQWNHECPWNAKCMYNAFGDISPCNSTIQMPKCPKPDTWNEKPCTYRADGVMTQCPTLPSQIKGTEVKMAVNSCGCSGMEEYKAWQNTPCMYKADGTMTQCNMTFGCQK